MSIVVYAKNQNKLKTKHKTKINGKWRDKGKLQPTEYLKFTHIDGVIEATGVQWSALRHFDDCTVQNTLGTCDGDLSTVWSFAKSVAFISIYCDHAVFHSALI